MAGRKKKKEQACPKGPPAWIVQFADLMSLLLVFFILLLSMSTLDAKKVSEAIGSLSLAMSVLEGGTMTEVSPERIQRATPIEPQVETAEVVNRVTVTVSEFNEIIRRQGGEETIQVQEAIEGFMIQLPAGLLFRTGSAEIHSSDSKLFLRRIAMMADTMPADLELVVRGHTDSSELPMDSLYRDNWSLSTARSVSVVKELVGGGVNPKRVSAAGHGEHRPIATNSTEQGRARNRRVEIHFLGKETSSEARAPRSILDVPAQ